MTLRSIEMLAISVSGFFLLLASAPCAQSGAQEKVNRTDGPTKLIHRDDTPSVEEHHTGPEATSKIDRPLHCNDTDDSCPVVAKQAPPPAASKEAAPPVSDNTPRRPPEAINSYDIDVTPKHGPGVESPAHPYRESYRFTAEADWFNCHIPVWNEILTEIKGAPGIRYLEVGCFEGRSAIWMIENVLTDESSSLTCIDAFLPQFGGDVTKNRFLSNVCLAGADERLEMIVGYSQTELRRLPLDSFDVIYQ